MLRRGSAPGARRATTAAERTRRLLLRLLSEAQEGRVVVRDAGGGEAPSEAPEARARPDVVDVDRAKEMNAGKVDRDVGARRGRDRAGLGVPAARTT